MTRAARPLVFAVAALAGCSNLFPDSERVPTSLLLEEDTITVIQGSPVNLKVTVLDQNGQAFDRVPGWAGPVLTLNGRSVVDEGGALRTVSPGETKGTVSVGRLSTEIVLRVNPSSLRLNVEGAYLTQSIQRADGSVPLVAGRDALARVFLRADQVNFFRPRVRLQLFNNGVLQRTLTLEPGADSIPVGRHEENLGSSWNTLIPASLVQPGMSYVVEADPGNVVPRTATSSIRFPAAGAVTPVVRTVPKLWLRLVPVLHRGAGAPGAVTPSNRAAYIRDLLAIHPIADYDVDVRSSFISSASAATGAGWEQILQEIGALRTLDGSSRYYYGIIQASGSSGIAGIGYVGYPVAMGVDALPNAAGTLAHELGHNFNRVHAPCGNPSGVDRAFPYAGADIGVFGYDLLDGTVKVPGQNVDLMSYCRPRWISDFNYMAVLNYRASIDGLTHGNAAGESAPAEPSLLVWGRIGGGTATIEPSFEVTTRPSLPTRPGPYTVRGLDTEGRVLFSLPFSGERMADGNTEHSHFSFAIPIRIAQPDRLARVVVSG
ncbi:MAG TPA: hypothetical protein VE913_08350, partial [Longimicrobium sp.]|nr:hypothetical protein [Longimicrobium sp.]